MTVRAKAEALPCAVWLLLIARAVNRLGQFSLPFLAVLITTDFAASTATAGLVVAAFGLATIPSRLAGGRLADRIGRRRTILLGLTGCAVTQLGLAASANLATATAFAILLGLAYELYEPPSQAFIADTVEPGPRRVRAFNMLNAAFAIGGMGAGLLAALLGRWDLRWLFVVDATSCLACAVVIPFALSSDLRDPRQVRAARGDEACAVRPWHDRALLIMLSSGTVFALVYLQVDIALPLALERTGFRATDAGLLFTASALTTVAAQPVMRRGWLTGLSAPAALALGHLFIATGMIGYSLASGFPAYLAATVLWSLGELLVMGRAFTVVADLAPPGGAGRYLAVYGLSWGVAGVVAPVIGTQFLDHASPSVMWAAMAVVSLTQAGAQLLVVRRLVDAFEYQEP
ncbi:MFS transporter [Catenulispora sp. GAS73]|uniref:MFS transporter n=1 Tax=Catenulispora sp. GAS73 TaxID=3156269 RepID=UPI003519AAC9